jgi:AcrR family transcriptional regulator
MTTINQRKQQVTREAILRALADTVLDEGADHFSVQEVADRAGLSHRTVYRHFPSREALLDGMADWLEEWTQERGLPGVAEKTEDLPASLEQVFSTFDTEDRMVRAHSMIILATGRQPSVRRRRTDAFREKLRTLAPDLPDQEFEASFAVIRMLAGSLTWFLLRELYGLRGAQSGPATAHAVEVLMDDLRRRNEVARDGKREP